MGTQPIDTFDVEEERQSRAAELEADSGPGWADEYKPGSFGCHELLDRTNLVADNVEQFVLSHPACIQNAEWYGLADQAVTALRELYQRVGAAALGTERNADEKRG